MDGKDDVDQSSYTFKFGPDKDGMFYVLVVYVSVIVLGILALAWKLKGYNKPDLTFDQLLELQKRKAARLAQAERIRKTQQSQEGPKRRRNIQSKIRQNVETLGGGDDAEVHAARDENEESMSDDEGKPSQKIGAKKLKKVQEKEERRKAREAMEVDRAERKKKREEDDFARKIEEENQEELEKQKEEEARKAREKKEEEEHQLYLELKESFEVNEERQDTVENSEQLQNRLHEFENYLKEKKVVLLEDLASHFGLRTQDAIDRVQKMLEDEIITGVIDDRGKFIFVSQEELKEVASFVTKRGRVAISEIAAASNRLINLNQDSKEPGPAVL